MIEVEGEVILCEYEFPDDYKKVIEVEGEVILYEDEFPDNYNEIHSPR